MGLIKKIKNNINSIFENIKKRKHRNFNYIAILESMERFKDDYELKLLIDDDKGLSMSISSRYKGVPSKRKKVED